MRPIAAPALTRPLFTEQDFTATKWDTGADKAWFANALCRFIAHDCPRQQWTQRLYRRLALCYGHIAHYNSQGFWDEFFGTLQGKVAFIEQTLHWPCFGQPDYTYCDVERAVQARLCAADTLANYRALRAAEVECAERALLNALRAKYDGVAPSKATELPIPRPPAPPRTHPTAVPERQTRLF